MTRGTILITAKATLRRGNDTSHALAQATNTEGKDWEDDKTTAKIEDDDKHFALLRLRGALDDDKLGLEAK
jgi:hypothetical protein